MKRLIFAIMLLASIAIPAAAQTPTFTSPQSVTLSPAQTGINAATTAVTSPCLSNLGQGFHLVSYTVAGTPTMLQMRLEYSYNSDSATCTTGTWFAMSDDATDTLSGEVVGIGAYPFLRINLVKCDGCGGGVNVSARYTGTSAISGTPYGFYNPSQQIRKVLFANLAVGGGTFPSVSGIAAPYGSAAGVIVIRSSGGSFSAGSNVFVTVHWGETSADVFDFALPTTGTNIAFGIPVPATPATTIDITVQNGAGAITLSAYYYFFPPGSAIPPGTQPPSASNTETTSAVNTAATKTLTLPGISRVERAHLFNVSARCSAGTAQITVADGATTVWSSAATEVGTTSFKNTWTPGLAGSPGNNLVITLTTCGAGNTGTLDVQGSIF